MSTYKIISDKQGIHIINEIDKGNIIYHASTNIALKLPKIPESVLKAYLEDNDNDILVLVLTKGRLTIEDNILQCYTYDRGINISK